MEYVLADRQLVAPDTAVGEVVTREIEVGDANGVLVGVTAFSVTVGGGDFFLVGVQTSNDLENWNTDIVNIINVTGVGYFEKRFDNLAAKYLRITYTTGPNSFGYVRVTCDTADL